MNLATLLDRLRRASRPTVVVALAISALFVLPVGITAAGADTAAGSADVAATTEPPCDPEAADCPDHEDDCEAFPEECLPEECTDPADPDCEEVCIDEETEEIVDCEPEPTTTTTAAPKPTTPKPAPKPKADKPVPAKPTFTG